MTPVWRDLPGWDLVGWRVFYVVMFLSLLIVLATGGLEPFGGGLVILAVGVGVAAVTSGSGTRGSSRARGQSAIMLQLPNAALFPHEMRILSDDAIPMQWPKLLREAEKRKRPVVVVASGGGRVASFGVQATVVENSGGFWLEGVSRVRVTRRRAVRPSVFQCEYATLVDEVGQDASATVSSVKDAFERWARDRGVDDSVLDEVRQEDDPGPVSDVIGASLTKLDPQRAENLLSTVNVAERLRLCVSLMADSLREGSTSNQQPSKAANFDMEEPDTLERLDDVGGMLPLKRQIANTIGFIAENPKVATRMRIAVNGVLLYGAPGTGKTMIARATAGEYGLKLLTVSSADVSADGLMGVAERKIEAAFRTAANNTPCLLFFDEFDSIAGKRDNKSGNEQYQRQIVAALLRGLDQIKKAPDVIVMAATNDIDSLDPALIRSGRFDARVRVDLPDAEARAAIFETRLRGLPTESPLDLAELVAATEGRSAADIVAIIESAKLAAARRGVESGCSDNSTIGHADLAGAIDQRRGNDSPGLEQASWDDVILPDETKNQLKRLVRLIEARYDGKQFGVKAPTGAVLTGPPGTGKTTIARVLASQLKGKVSFIPSSGSDLVGKYVGESSDRMRKLFDRAREQAPTVIFIDEVNAILPTRGGELNAEREGLVAEFLQQLDGLARTPDVFVLGATNAPERLDAAATRSGRLGRWIEIPLPDEVARRALFELYLRPLPSEGTIDVAVLATESEQASGADIAGICSAASEVAFLDDETPRPVRQADLEQALDGWRNGLARQ